MWVGDNVLYLLIIIYSFLIQYIKYIQYHISPVHRKTIQYLMNSEKKHRNWCIISNVPDERTGKGTICTVLIRYI